MKVLRQELQGMQPQAGHCRVEVSREEIFEVCAQEVSHHTTEKHIVSQYVKYMFAVFPIRQNWSSIGAHFHTVIYRKSVDISYNFR